MDIELRLCSYLDEGFVMNSSRDYSSCHLCKWWLLILTKQDPRHQSAHYGDRSTVEKYWYLIVHIEPMLEECTSTCHVPGPWWIPSSP